MESLLSRDLLLSAFAVVFGIAYVYAAQHVLLQIRRRRLEKHKEVRAVIGKGLRSGALTSIDDFIDAYRGILKLGADDDSHRSGLARALREFVVDIVNDEACEATERQRMKDAASTLLRRLEAESPFADLPAAERNLLRDIDRFTQAGEREHANGKLQDLAGLIEARQDAMNRLQSSNRWAVPLAFVGLLLTVVFGVISLLK